MIVYQMLNGRRSTKVRTVGGNNEGYYTGTYINTGGFKKKKIK